MRTIILLSVMLLVACSPAELQVSPGDIVVLVDIQEFKKTDKYQDCPRTSSTKVEDICIEWNCGYAEYTYNALSIKNYVAGDAYSSEDRTKRLTVLETQTHHCIVWFYETEVVVRLGTLWDQVSTEDSAEIYLSKDGPYIIDPIFIQKVGWADYYKELPEGEDPVCYSIFFESDNYEGEEIYLAAMKAPGGYENEDEEMCLSWVVLLKDVQDLPSNKTLQQDQPTAGR